MNKKVKYGQRFKSRPIKSAGKKRQRIKVHRARLVEAGWEESKVTKMDAKSLREALKASKL